MGLLLSLAAAAWGQPPGSVPPVFTQRLRVPVRGDDLTQPRAVVADFHTGEVFVCDMLRNRIVIFDDQGRFRYQIPGGSAFQSPVDLAVDPDGFLFVVGQVTSDFALIDFDGRFIRRISLDGLPEEAASPRFGSLATTEGGGTLYLMDEENDRLWITDRDGAILNSIDMTVGRPPKEVDELRYGHVDVYADTVLVPVPTDGLVHLFDLDGHAQGTIGAQGSAECQTMFPIAAALDDEGRIIILDQQRALFMTWDRERGVCLSEHYGFGNAPGAFYQPNDMALDRAGRLYVSQGFEGRVQVYEGARPAAGRPAGLGLEVASSAERATAGREVVGESRGLEEARSVDEPGAAPGEQTVDAPAVATLPESAVAAASEERVPSEATVADRTMPEAAEPAALLVAGARRSVERAVRYDTTYAEIAFPGGDVPLDRGAATDLVIRAFRHAGVDLQEALQRDVVEAAGAYAIREPDPNIDHRRIRNLVMLFERKALSLSTGPDGDWAAGDVVFWDRDSDGVAGHVGVVTDEIGGSGRPLVIHHHRPQGEFPGSPGAGDVLLRWPVVGHYRWVDTKESGE